MKMPSLPANTEPFVWGAVCGAIVISIIGFGWGGWVTGGTAEQLAVARADEAIVASLVPVCVAQFQKGPKVQASLAALKATETWHQAEFVEKGGWASVPGGGEPNRLVLSGCADALGKLVL